MHETLLQLKQCNLVGIIRIWCVALIQNLLTLVLTGVSNESSMSLQPLLMVLKFFCNHQRNILLLCQTLKHEMSHALLKVLLCGPPLWSLPVLSLPPMGAGVATAVDRIEVIITSPNVTLHHALPAISTGARGVFPRLNIAELDCQAVSIFALSESDRVKGTLGAVSPVAVGKVVTLHSCIMCHMSLHLIKPRNHMFSSSSDIALGTCSLRIIFNARGLQNFLKSMSHLMDLKLSSLIVTMRHTSSTPCWITNAIKLLVASA